MQIIDTSYFVGQLYIAGLSEPWNQEVVDEFILSKTPEYMSKMLGDILADLFLEGLDEDTVDERWEKLLKGDTYTGRDGKDYKWKGFANDSKVSPLANYVYYAYMANKNSVTTVAGEKVDETAGAKANTSTEKLVTAWNLMVDMNFKLHDYLSCKKGDDGELLYPEYQGWYCRSVMATKTNRFDI